MNDRISRRDLLRLAGGSALGLLLTPLPWKVLDDSSIWTQNWPWIPAPQGGPVGVVPTTCTLCPVGCGVNLRTVSSVPVSVSGVPHHPVSAGAVCVVGLLAHHLRYHPERLRRPVRIDRGRQTRDADIVGREEIITAVAAALGSMPPSDDPAALFVDSRPGRASSALLRALAAHQPGAAYVPHRPYEPAALRELMEATGQPGRSLSFDLERVKTILSIRTPVMDGWGSPGLPGRLLDRRRQNGGSPVPWLIQVDPTATPTSQFADEWIAPLPGTESLLLQAIARIAVEEGLVSRAVRESVADFGDLRRTVESIAAGEAARQAMVPVETVQRVARRIMRESPAAVITPAATDAVTAHWAAVLNVLAGSLGRGGCIREPRGVPLPDELARFRNGAEARPESVGDHSVRVMIIDESLSGLHREEEWIRRKLVEEDGIILSLAPFVTPRAYATQFVLPSPVAGEAVTDLEGVDDRGRSVYAVALPLVEAPAETVDSFSLCRLLSRALGAEVPAAGRQPVDLLKARAERLLASGRGSLFNGATGETSDLTSSLSAEDVWSVLAAGGCWTDDESPACPARRWTVAPMPESAPQGGPHPSARIGGEYPLVLVQAEDPSLRQASAVSPLISKLYEESGLRLYGNRALLHPATAAEFGLSEGRKAVLETPSGSASVRVALDAAIRPGIVVVRGTSLRSETAQESPRAPLLADSGGSTAVPQPARLLKA